MMIPHSKPTISGPDADAVVACLRTGMINEGELVANLERAFVDGFGGAAAVATGSGSQSLLLALMAHSGAEVIVPTYVCPEVVAVVEHLGLDPVLVDIDGEDYLPELESTRAAVNDNTRAAIVPWLFGIHGVDSPLMDLGVPVIVDCAQCITVPGIRQLMSEQQVTAVFSFEATKVLASGEGGIVLTSDAGIGARLRALKRYGDTDYKLNLFPMSDLTASLALSQLQQLDEFVERRRAIARAYDVAFDGNDALQLPSNAVRERSTYFRYPVRLRTGRPSVDEIIAAYARLGVAVRRPVDVLMHRLRSVQARFEQAERAYESVFSLPIYPSLIDGDVDRVIAATRSVFSESAE